MSCESKLSVFGNLRQSCHAPWGTMKHVKRDRGAAIYKAALPEPAEAGLESNLFVTLPTLADDA